MKKFKLSILTGLLLTSLGLGLASAQAQVSEVTVATSGTSDIFSQIMPSGEWTGIDGDIWKEIDERTDWEIEIKQVEFDGLIGELDTDRSDVVSNHMEVTEARLERAIASQPYSSEETVWVILEENVDEITGVEALEGKTVGVKSGQAVQPIVVELSEEHGFTVQTYQDNASMYNDLAMGRIDAVAGMLSQINSNSEKLEVEFTNTGEPLLAGNVAFFLQNNEEGEALKAELDAVIQEMLDDGTIAEITENWTGQDLTKAIFTEDEANAESTDSEDADDTEEVEESAE